MCFLQKRRYYSDQCKVVTDINTRRSILKSSKICFNCLKAGHIKKNCKTKVKCYRCKTEVSHHTALCYPKNNLQKQSASTPQATSTQSNRNTDNKEETSPNLIRNNTTILLQIATGCVLNKTEEHFCVVNILLDHASQQTFITE